MTGEMMTTAIGNLTDAPDLRYVGTGNAVVNFSVAVNSRVYDRDTSEWKDGDPTYIRCTLWREAAEHMANSLHKGDRVIVTGRLKQNRWTDKTTGTERSTIELDVEEIGPSLRWATARVERTQGGNSGGQLPARSGAGHGSGGGGRQSPPADDPWASAPAAGSDDRAPF